MLGEPVQLVEGKPAERVRPKPRIECPKPAVDALQEGSQTFDAFPVGFGVAQEWPLKNSSTGTELVLSLIGARITERAALPSSAFTERLVAAHRARCAELATPVEAIGAGRANRIDSTRSELARVGNLYPAWPALMRAAVAAGPIAAV